MSSAAHTNAPAMAWAAVVCRKSSGSCGFTGGMVELASTEGGASVEEAARAGEAVLEAVAAAATVGVAAASPSPAPITLDTHTCGRQRRLSGHVNKGGQEIKADRWMDR